jgi:hypothetical protein
MDKVRGPLDLTNQIIDFEAGELNDEQVAELFQHLVDTGMAWTLQGSYGRTAQALLDAGVIHQPSRGKVVNPRSKSD